MLILERSKIVLLLTLVIVLCTSVVLANPSGAVSTYGNATITQPNANTVQVNIPGNKAIINWNSFSIANGELTQFVFANTANGKFGNAVLNRVTGSTPSTIAGQLQANGAVFLVNPNGIVFSGTGQVNVPGFFATTLNISDAQFKAFSPTQTSTDQWKMVFNAVPGTAGTIELQNGAQIITQGQDGVIALMAKSIQVAQGVTLSAPNGTVMLMAAKEVTMSQAGYGDYGMFNIAYRTETGNNVTNSGLITILDGNHQGGGTVAMVGDNVTQSGTIAAATSDQKVSRILLVASNDVVVSNGSVSDVSGTTNRAGYIGIVAGGTATVANGATITALGNTNNGGDVTIKGNGVVLGSSAVIDVSATNGNPGNITTTVNGGGDLYVNVEYARLAVRPSGDKMVLVNDGTINLPPVLPLALKQQAESSLSKVMKIPFSIPGNEVKMTTAASETKPVEVKPQSTPGQSFDAKVSTDNPSKTDNDKKDKQTN